MKTNLVMLLIDYVTLVKNVQTMEITISDLLWHNDIIANIIIVWYYIYNTRKGDSNNVKKRY